MGYYTSHKLEILEVHDETDLIVAFRESCDSAEYSLLPDGRTNESSKWYDADDDLKRFSKKYPLALFCLTGEGEESADIWKLYVRNGKSFRAAAKITFEKFTENKLS